MKNTLCPSFLITDMRDPNPNGGLFSPVKKGLFSGAADVVNSMFMVLLISSNLNRDVFFLAVSFSRLLCYRYSFQEHPLDLGVYCLAPPYNYPP